MSRLAFAAIAALLVIAAPAAAGPHLGWPSHGPFEWPSLHHPTRVPGDGHRLPQALIHGPNGPQSFPYVDRRAHRSIGAGTRRFPRPMAHGARLDWCVEPSAGCGPHAAQAFCAARGFTRVVEAVQERHVGRYAATRQLGSGLVCAGSGCHGFMVITCTRN